MASQRKRSYATSFKREYSVEIPCIAKGKEASTAFDKHCCSYIFCAKGSTLDQAVTSNSALQNHECQSEIIQLHLDKHCCSYMLMIN